MSSPSLIACEPGLDRLWAWVLYSSPKHWMDTAFSNTPPPTVKVIDSPHPPHPVPLPQPHLVQFPLLCLCLGRSLLSNGPLSSTLFVSLLPTCSGPISFTKPSLTTAILGQSPLWALPFALDCLPSYRCLILSLILFMLNTKLQWTSNFWYLKWALLIPVFIIKVIEIIYSSLYIKSFSLFHILKM